jgi:phosphatidate cytidylyltransferase
VSKIQTGRNLPVATAIGIFLIALVIASLFINKYVFVALALSALLLAAHEITNQWAKSKKIVASYPLIAFSILIMTLSSVIFGFSGLLISFTISTILNLIYSLLTRHKSNFRNIFAISLFSFSYLGIFGSLAMLMLRTEEGAGRVFLFIAITALSDTGGYLIGILIGKHRIAPKISPKKSYEGLLGSIVFASVFASLVGPKLVDIQIIEGLILGFVLAISGTLGDLFESSLKRKLDIKDFSTLIPGHGGMFDRLDSLAPNALVSFLLFGLFLGFN